jgi:hypothetical protein
MEKGPDMPTDGRLHLTEEPRKRARGFEIVPTFPDEATCHIMLAL